jgi:hypothetical protein
MLRLGIQSSGFQNERKISGFHGSADSHNFVPGYVTIWFGKLPTIQGITLLCLKHLHVLMIKTVRSSVTPVFIVLPTLFHKAELLRSRNSVERDGFIIISNFIEKLREFNKVLHRYCLLFYYFIFWTAYGFNYMKFVVNI